MIDARFPARAALLFFLLAPLMSHAAEELSPSDVLPADGYGEIAKSLTDVVERELRDKNLPAISLALVDGERVVWARGFGLENAEAKRPTDASTVYRVGSVSKLFADLAVMQLVERGELDLDTPVTDYLPEFQPKNPFGTPITLRQLMSHRSGLVRESPVGNYFDPDEPSLKATVESLNDTTLVYPPGTRTKYSNAGIAVVGYVLERKLKTPFAEIVRKSILTPLDMTNSDFEPTNVVSARLADAWMWTYDRRRFAAPEFVLGTAPAGNLYSSVLDLSKFAIAVFRQGEGTQGRILRPETLHQMLTLQSDDAGELRRYGLGFHLDQFDGRTIAGHGGAVYGFSTQWAILPKEKLGAIVACSLDGTNGVVKRIQDFALRLMLARREGGPLPEWEFTAPIPLELARSMDGTYRAGDKTLQLEEESGRVMLMQREYRRELRATKDGLVVDDAFGRGIAIARRSADELVVDGETYRRSVDEAPADVPPRWKGLIGEYGWEHNVLYIHEREGRLHALIEWFFDYPLTEIGENEFAFPEEYGLYHGEKLFFTRNDRGETTHVAAADVTFTRRETETKDGETFKIVPLKPIEELRRTALTAEPPAQAADLRPSELVELIDLEPGIRLDIRYATTNNFMGEVFYKQPRAFLQKPAADATVRVHRKLREHGVGLLVHDAYRPWFVTKMFYDATPDELKHFVANPAQGSRHNRGCAVDLTLFDLETGLPVPMVAGYDEFSTRSYPYYPGGTSRQRWYRKLLRQSMEAEGFTIYEFEWWHFDYGDWRLYPIGNRRFEEIDPE